MQSIKKQAGIRSITLSICSVKYVINDLLAITERGQNPPCTFDKCDRVCIKGPLVGNLKNEIIKFYDKLGFKVSFLLISERNLLFLLY